MKSEVLNNSIGSPYDFSFPKLTKQQDREILAGLFEQLLVFDRIYITTNRLNFALVFLLDRLGIKTVEKLFELGYLKIMLWTPVIVTARGKQKADGTYDESHLIGKPPIAAGSLTNEDLDKENNIQKALSYFTLHRDRKRIFQKIAAKNYVIPDGMEFSTESANFVINAYEKNNLANLGLPFVKDANSLNFEERKQMLDLGHKVLETAILSKYNLKSFENYEHFAICQNNFKNIGKAYNVSESSTNIFKLENLPNLKELFLKENLEFESVFKLRNLSSAKYYRKWINNVGENSNSQEITKEYLDEIKGKKGFFESSEGKFLKLLCSFTVGIKVGSAISGVPGTLAGLGLSLLENYWLDNLLKGKNPSMFIEDIRNEILSEE